MRPGTFAAALAVAAAVGFAVGRWSISSTSRPVIAPPAASIASDDAVTVVSVTDGDTLVVAPSRQGGAEERVRLLAIDTPERGQPGHAEAREALSDLVGGRAVRLDFEEPGVLKRDRYGRILAYVLVDGSNANIEIVRLGWSAYTSRNGGARFSKQLVDAEEEARAARRGIWALR
jgi:micrococcal nuclease